MCYNEIRHIYLSISGVVPGEKEYGQCPECVLSGLVFTKAFPVNIKTRKVGGRNEIIMVKKVVRKQ